MYDDFMSGYNFGSTPRQNNVVKFSESTQQMAAGDRVKRDQKVPSVYNTTKYIRMTGPLGEQGEIYANGKMYIIIGTGKGKVRTFPSRPYGIKYMQKKGWALV